MEFLSKCYEMEIKDGLLEGADMHLDHRNKGGVIRPMFIVLHYTAGPTYESAIRSLTNPARQASAHFIIDKIGRVAQLVETDRIAWHAGVSSFHHGGSYYRGLNRFSVGIEFVNAGRLLKAGNGKYRTWWGSIVPDEDVIIPEDRFHYMGSAFERFTEEQLEAGLAVAHAIIKAHLILDIIGHSDIAPGRKIDPGPAFPMQSFKSLLQPRNFDPEVFRG